MKKAIASVLASAMLVMSLAGCGGSGTSATTAAPAQSAASQNAPAAPAGSSAVNYPNGQTITIVVGFSAGGTADLGARILANYLGKALNTNVIVTNVTGGSGTVAGSEVYKGAADGYTLLSIANSPAFALAKQNSLPFETTVDFVPIAAQQSLPRTIVFRADDPRFSTGEEFLAYAKEHPGEITVATSGAQSVPEAMQRMLKEQGYEFTSVPTGGATEQKTQLLGGHVDAAGISVSDIMTYDAGSIGIVAVAADERYADLPEVPTFKELGVDLELSTVRGYAVKAGTDPEIIRILEDAIAEISQSEEYQKELVQAGAAPCYMNGADYLELMKRDMDMFKTYFGNN